MNCTNKILISNHAVIRYFERVLGYDIEEIRNKILPDNMKAAVETLGDCSFTVDGVKRIVKGKKVMTVYKMPGKIKK